MAILAGLVGAVAFAAWCVAVYSLFRIVGLAPAGERFSTLFDLGWWKFDKIRARVGAAADPLIRNYVGAFLAFFGCVILIAVLSVFLATEQQENGREDIAAASAILLPTLA
jgi:uncharacterized membrane protein YidH (DUF202 family)